MMKNRVQRLLTALCCLAAVGSVATGCIKDDTSDCSYPFRLTVRAQENDGTNCDQQVQDVMLYVFDAQDRFVRQIPATIGVPVEIQPLASGAMNIVAWGNIETGNHILPVINSGDPITAGRIGLRPDTRAASPFYSPGELFHGQISLTQNDQQGERVIPMTRKMGSMNVTIKKLKGYSGFVDDDFSIRVGETHSQLDLAGTLCGAMALYRPDGMFSSDVFTVPSFNMLCNTGLYIDIYHGSDKILTVNSHNGGLPIAVEEGKTTSVLIDFTGELSVSVYVTEWGEQYTWKEF